MQSFGDTFLTAAQYFYGEIGADKLTVNDAEIRARLQVKGDYREVMTDKCLINLQSVIRCAYSAVKVPVVFSESSVNLGFGEIMSRNLAERLKGCDEAFVFAVTLGYGVDRLLSRLAVTSVSEHFVTDAFASALAEAACDYTEKILAEGLSCGRRFSLGYGDLPLFYQARVLAAVRADKTLGITLSDTLLMSPKKSVTAILGILK